MTIQYKKSVRSNRTLRCCRNKDFLKPFKAYFIGGPAVGTNFDIPIAWNTVFFIPTLYMNLSFKDNAGRD